MRDRLRILHLEDDSDYCALIKELLNKNSLQADLTIVDNATDFDTALEKTTFDVILADYSLPNWTGLDALKTARQKRPDTPFLIVSGTIGEEAAIGSLKAGATDYVPKHWPDRIVPAVRRAVQEAEERGHGKWAEAQLRLLKTALESAANACVVTDRSGGITWANPAFSKLTGYSFEEVRGQRINLLRSGEHQGAFYRELWETILSGAVWRGEMINRRKDGSLYTVESTITPICNEHAEITHFVAVKQDVTDRKRAEVALRQREEWFRTLFELAPDGIYLCDLQGTFVDGNKAAEELVGYDRFELVGKTFLRLNLLSADDLQKAAASLAQNIQGNPTGPEEYVLRRKDGRQIPVEVRTFPVQLQDKALVLGIARDISERKKLELGLADALRFNETVIAASSLGLLAYRASGECILSNSAAARIIGATEEQLRAQNFHRIESWQTSGLLESARKALAGPTEMRLEFHTISTFGRTCWADCRLIPFTSAGQPHLLVIMDDISRRKEAEEALRESTRQQQYLLNTIPDPAWLKDGGGHYLAVNKAWCQLLERKAEQVIGKTDSDLIPAGVRRVFQHEKLEVMTQRGQSRNEQFLEDSRGRSVCYEVINSAIYNEVGKAVGTVGIARDVTERKQLEAQLRQSQKMEAIGQLAGGVAHDFNNMLAVIRGNVDLLLMNPGQHSPEAHECLKHIVGAAERAASLTRQLLIFSRKQAMQPEPLMLTQLITNLAKMLKRVIREDVHLECRHTEPLPFVQGDAGMIEQVLINLVVNARDAMPHGGKLLIRTEAVSFDTRDVQTKPEARAGQFVCLTVSDTGIGIAEENLPRIFEPFFTTKEPGRGTGLGLATVYGIVKQHEGWVEVYSRVGEGTTFKVFLPAAQPPEKTTAATLEPELCGGTETILLVEDDFSVRMTIRRGLERYKYKVLEATCARDALQLWANHAEEVALLLTDMIMPDGLTGRELAEQLRAQRPELKVIFMSGYSAEMAGRSTEFFRRMKSYFLQKPCSIHTMIRTIRQCLDEENGGTFHGTSEPPKSGC